MPLDSITVPAERGAYEVVVGAGALRRLGPWLGASDGQPDRRNVLVVSCPPVWRRHGGRLGQVTTAGPAVLIGDGERAKNLTSIRRIYDACVERRLDRGSTIVAFGGGVVGDVAGFAAATYLRGIRLVQVPTTLLAQVDSAIGGKVGVNLPAGKNLVGAFHAPSLVICDPELLATLPAREFRSGLYEVIKYGVIASRPLFERLERDLDEVKARDVGVLTPVIATCCRIKADVVARDEREAGPRRVLNFGHTVAHALEAVTDYRRFRHGEAVAYGMLAAAGLSVARGVLPPDAADRLRALVARLGPLPPVADLRGTEVLAAVRRDKKVVGRRLHFVLAAGLGTTTVASDVTTAELRTAIRRLGIVR